MHAQSKSRCVHARLKANLDVYMHAQSKSRCVHARLKANLDVYMHAQNQLLQHNINDKINFLKHNAKVHY